MLNTFLNTPNDPLNNSPKKGLAILVSKNIDPQKINVQNISPGKATKVDFQLNEHSFSAFCIYASSQGDSDSEKFYTDLLEIAEETDNSIIIGYFNVVLDPKNGQERSKQKLSQAQHPQITNHLHASTYNG